MDINVSISFDITADGKPISFWELPEADQTEILQMISDDFNTGKFNKED